MDNISEEVFFEKNNVLVTKSKLVIHGTTYAMSLINSVSMDMAKEEVKNPIGCTSIAFIIFGLFLLLSPIWILGVVMIIIGLFITFASFLAAPTQKKCRHFLIINTASGNTSALESSSFSYISSLKEAIEKAIASRG